MEVTSLSEPAHTSERYFVDDDRMDKGVIVLRIRVYPNTDYLPVDTGMFVTRSSESYGARVTAIYEHEHR